MRRKRYKKRWGWVPVVLGLAAFVAASALVLQGVGRASAVSDREELDLARRAIRQAAVSCYALEGAYPATYQDLKDNCAIAVNEEKYAVFYEIFASNIMPEITVTERWRTP